MIQKVLDWMHISLAQLPFLSDSNLFILTIQRRLEEVHIQR